MENAKGSSEKEPFRFGLIAQRRYLRFCSYR